MHPLTKLLFEEGHFSGHRKPIEAEKVITTYLRERADWLMNSCLHKNGRSSVELIEQAFELSEKCCCGEPETPNVVHRKDNPCYVNTLPSKFVIEPKSFMDFQDKDGGVRTAINQLIDYLHSKEAREEA